MSPILLLLLLLIFFLTTFIPQSLGDDDQVRKYLDCMHRPFECGNFTANYPFWGAYRPRSCGHPQLELRCEDYERPIILLGGVKYKIHLINEKSKILKISRADYQHGLCNPQLQSTTLPSSILSYYNYSETEMIIFFYNCSSVSDPLTASPEPSSSIESMEKAMPMVQLSCSDKHGLIMKNNSHVPQGCDCQSNLTVQVHKILVSPWLDDLSLLQRGLREGFEVKWNDSGRECEKCIKFNNGSCTYDLENSKMVCYCLDDRSGLVTTACPAPQESPAPSGHRKRTFKISISVALGITAGITNLVCILRILYSSEKQRKSEDSQMVEDFLRSYGNLGPQRYSYHDIKMMTDFFSTKLGQGGSGDVYKGELRDGRHVAVKLLKASKGNGEEFINEVASISRTSHVNVVTSLGFCFEKKKRGLVYEFMPNGSLDKYIYG